MVSILRRVETEGRFFQRPIGERILKQAVITCDRESVCVCACERVKRGCVRERREGVCERESEKCVCEKRERESEESVCVKREIE